jgi:peptidoglycan/xylan/chitin deacetylase (PgdA/CDA1 family)
MRLSLIGHVALTGCLPILASCTVLQPSKPGLADRTVVLTFDDGPNPHADVTRRLLAVLARHEVKAIHCVIGKYAAENPELMDAYIEAGHTIANHGYDHPLPLLTLPGPLYEDHVRCQEVIESYPNPDGRDYVRPPYGLVTGPLRRYMETHNATLVPLTFFINDAMTGPDHADALLLKFLKAIRKHRGGIVVIHEGRWPFGGRNVDTLRDSPSSGYNRAWIPDLVDRLITTLKGEGYAFSAAVPE